MINQPIFILERFPDKRHLLSHRMATDHEFYALCHDHEICVEALKHWAVSDKPEATERLREYRALVRELEAEIMDDLKSSAPQPLD